MPPSLLTHTSYSGFAPSVWADVCRSNRSVSLSPPPPKGHFSTCAFNVIPCPNRCSVKLTRRDLPDHLQHDCPKRKVKCEFCGSEFTGEAYEVNTEPVLPCFFVCFFRLSAWLKHVLQHFPYLYERNPCIKQHRGGNCTCVTAVGECWFVLKEHVCWRREV